jgi:hypothetical protein
MRRILAVLVPVVALGGSGIVGAAEPVAVPSVRYANGAIRATAGGEPLVFEKPNILGVIRSSSHLLPVAADDAVGRHGQKDGDFTAVLIVHAPDVVGWVQTDDLILVTTATTSLAPSAKAIGKPRDVGVTLDAGAPVEVLERTKTAAHIRFADGWLRTDGWVPLAAVGPVFPEIVDRPSGDDFDNQSRLPDEMELLASPAGKPLVTLRRPVWPDVTEKLGKVTRKHVLVELRWGRVKVVGWLAEDRLVEPSQGGGFGVLRGEEGGPAGSNWDKETVAPGTQVLDKPGGTVLGQYDAKANVKVLETKDGFRRIQLWTELDSRMTVWLAPAVKPATPR